MESNLIKYYNDLVEPMNQLKEKGFKVDTFKSPAQGLGFYIETGCNDCYIQVDIWDKHNSVKLMRHNSKCGHDCINDIVLERESNVSHDNTMNVVELYIKESVHHIKLDFESLFNTALTNEIENVGGSIEPALDTLGIYRDETRQAIKDWYGWEEDNDSDPDYDRRSVEKDYDLEDGELDGYLYTEDL